MDYNKVGWFIFLPSDIDFGSDEDYKYNPGEYYYVWDINLNYYVWYSYYGRMRKLGKISTITGKQQEYTFEGSKKYSEVMDYNTKSIIWKGKIERCKKPKLRISPFEEKLKFFLQLCPEKEKEYQFDKKEIN